MNYFKFLINQTRHRDRGHSELYKSSDPRSLEIIHLMRLGHTFSEVAQSVNRCESTCKVIYYKWINTRDVEDLDRSGGPPKITQQEKEMFINCIRNHPNIDLNKNLK